jgi:hypothetical protein
MPTIRARVLAAAIATTLLWPSLASEATAQTMADTSAALTTRGAWSASVNYVLDDVVTSRGSSWRALRASKGKLPGQTSPSTAADWETLAAGFNPLGAWISSATYQPNDLTSFQGATWRAKRTNFAKTPATSPLDWDQLAARGAKGNTGADGANGAQGPIGATGARGPRGLQGDIGDTGPRGPRGLAGAIAPLADGTVSAPAINFASSTNTGIFLPEPGKIALAEGSLLFLHNVGTKNTALGLSALSSSSGGSNTALGFDALASNTSGNNNTAMGVNALLSNTDGIKNTAVGVDALSSNTTGGGANTAVGFQTMTGNTTGEFNTALGIDALSSNIDGGDNTALGADALTSSSHGGGNTAVGVLALAANNNGFDNIALGRNAGFNAAASSDSIFIGNQGSSGDTATLKIGTQGTQTTAFMAGISGVNIGNSVAVVVNGNGQLGVVASSRRYKQDIQPMGDASATLMKLRPVTFRYKKAYANGDTSIQYGLIAEEVAEAFPHLAVFNKGGQPETVKYHLLPALLLNEYQRQQKTIAAQAAQAERQQKTIESQAEQMAGLQRRLSAIEARLAHTVSTAALPAMPPL